MPIFSNVSPTRGNLIELQRSLELAREGHSLLDRKRNVLVREMMRYLDEAKTLQEEMDRVFQAAYLALQRANLDIGIERVEEIGFAVSEIQDLDVRLKSIMGVEIPEISWDRREESRPAYGVYRTSAALDKAYLAFRKVVFLIIRLAVVENAVYRLAVEIKKTQKRVNALENVVIPDHVEKIKLIRDILEEQDREDFFKMKLLKRREERSKEA
ncbi:V-type ATP synthase subunit D [Atrimonas thermophila]|uniref:V-type ATP synthase subunit D n=1 Tax=Atrimonas thermophila TaxID=3064161 RepID=UPI00399CF96A